MHQIYGFKYDESCPPHLFILESIGCQSVSDSSYDWDGGRRSGNSVLLQVTTEGSGMLQYECEQYEVGKGTAYLATIPGKNRYYYSEKATEPWSFYWIRFHGLHALTLWTEWLDLNGPLIAMSKDSIAFTMLVKLYEDAGEGRLRDAYQVSLRIYEWILALQDQMNRGLPSYEAIPEDYQALIRSINQSFREPVTLDELASRMGVSKHHFCKQFACYYRDTPMQYIRKRRVEEAAKLLRQTSWTIGEISNFTGFDSLSYFGKVFRRYAGCSPTEFREANGEHALDVLKLI